LASTSRCATCWPCARWPYRARSARSPPSTALAVGLALWWGWSIEAGIVLGLAVSVASTVVMLRALTEGDLMETTHGKVAIGWLIVEDLLTVLALVLLPILAGAGRTLTARRRRTFSAAAGTAAVGVSAAPVGLTDILVTVGLTLAKVAVLVAVMLFAGARFVPWLLVLVSRTGSRELFILAVLAVAFGWRSARRCCSECRWRSGRSWPASSSASLT